MAYDAKLAGKVSKILQTEQGFEEKKMFGGICFLINGNMACGILNDELIVRVGPNHYQDILQLPHARKFDITGRPMKGWVMVASKGLSSITALQDWVNKGTVFAKTLPRKKR